MTRQSPPLPGGAGRLAAAAAKNDGLADLRSQQRALAALLRQETPSAEAADALLRPLHNRPPRLPVYHHAYRARLTAALRSNHPALHRLLGDDAFDALALDYLAAHPSRQPSIRWFGDQLADFLARAKAQVHHPALADLARMEWALCASFDAADAAPLTFADLAALPPAHWPQLRLAPHPSVFWLDLRWAVEPLWQALQSAPLGTDDLGTAPPEPLIHTLLVWRQGLDTRWRSLPADEAALLGACLTGEPFATLCERVARTGGGEHAGTAPAPSEPPVDPAWQMAARLRGWVDDGLLLLRRDPDGDGTAPTH